MLSSTLYPAAAANPAWAMMHQARAQRPRLQPAQQQRSYRASQTRLRPRAELVGPALAAAQQELALGVVLGFEGVYSKLTTELDFKYAVPQVAGGAVLIGAYVLMDKGAIIPGLLLGAVTATAMVYFCYVRVKNTEDDGLSWPGPKTLPAFQLFASTMGAIAAVESAVRIATSS